MRLRNRDAASYLGVSPRTLEKWRLLGVGPEYIRFRRVVVYETRALDDYLQSHRRASTSEEPPRTAA